MRKFGKEKYRVIQWAAGTQGRFDIAMVCERPNLELVGLYVTSPEKVGKDAGELAGIGPIGIKATNDIDALLATEADCVLYSPLWHDLDVICRILASGKNIVTQVGYVYLKQGPERDRIEAACRQGGSSFMGTGINPGFFSDRMGVAFTALNRSVKKITVREWSPGYVANISEQLIWEAMGFGWTQERLDKGEEPPLFSGVHDRCFTEAGDYVGAALGFKVDRFDKKHDYVFSDRTFKACGRTVQPGQVVAVRNTYRVFSEGIERAVFIQAWSLDPSVETGWGYSDEFYEMVVEGVPSFRMTWHPEGDPMGDALLSTAAAVVNAIPILCDAPPGIHSTFELPMTSWFGELTR